MQEVEQIVKVGELSTLKESKKRVGDARKCKELQEKRAHL